MRLASPLRCASGGADFARLSNVSFQVPGTFGTSHDGRAVAERVRPMSL